MANYKSTDPYRQEVYHEFELHSDSEVEQFIAQSKALDPYSEPFDFESRQKAVLHLQKVLKDREEKLARAISREMGKVLKEAKAEVQKCAWLCDYYAHHADQFLSTEILDLEGARVERRYEPLGLILGIMPWNFPFWQVFRFAVPSLLAGNRVFLKHAPNCPHCGELLAEIFQASFPEGAYRNLRLSNDQVSELLEKDQIRGLSLTGSTQAGSTVAAQAAKMLKPQLLELGGSNAFVLYPDASIDFSAKLAAQARLMNAGQSCIAAKRFIVPEEKKKDFTAALVNQFKAYKLGDPLKESTDIGPLARPDLAEKVKDQIERGIKAGAHLILGGERRDNFIEATIVEVSDSTNPLFQEEIFGPVAVVIAYTKWDEAVRLSNENPFGLGVSLIGTQTEELLREAQRFEEGAVFINELVKSDPRLPFGGVKKSGYGRELGPEGIRAFCNLKTVYLKKG